MKRIFFVLASLCFSFSQRVFAVSEWDIGFRGDVPDGSILSSGGNKTPISVLSIIQSFLLNVVLPLIIVGTALYIAYQLFTAEGDETRMKKAWKSVAYSAIALIAIGLSYALVSIISTISF